MSITREILDSVKKQLEDKPMSVPATGWSNKNGTTDRDCPCKTWKQHWINFSNKVWPEKCSVKDCENEATLGAHVINDGAEGERIAPLCDSCNKLTDSFTLKGSTSVPSANKAKTCEKPKEK
jgi:hypothetical protein